MKQETIVEKDWDELSYRDRIDRIGISDIIAVFDLMAEGSMNRDEAEKKLQQMQMENIDLCLEKDFKHSIEQAKKEERDKIAKEVEDAIKNTQNFSDLNARLFSIITRLLNK